MREADDIPPVETAEPGAWPGGVCVWAGRFTGPTARKGALAVGAQGMSSAVSFGVGVGIGIALARFATQEESGAYVPAFSMAIYGKAIEHHKR